ncbi:MAG: transposase [bacterium]|nr:transposase [bacterium]
MEYLRAQRELFGDAASDSTLYRAIRGLGAGGGEALSASTVAVRERLWAGAERAEPLVVDIDSTPVEVHSENKQGAAPDDKGGYGFRPMVCSAAGGEPLWVKQRPGNAAANSISDHLEVLDAAVAVLPRADAAGRRGGGGGDLVRRPLVARADAAGRSTRIARGCRDRNVGYCVSARAAAGVRAAVGAASSDPDRRQDAERGTGRRRSRAQAADLTGTADLSGRPEGTRLVARREPLRPGAQRSLFDSDHRRYWGFCTDQSGEPARPDRLMRSHADAADAVRRLKGSGLARMPFTDWDANAAWAALCMIGLALVKEREPPRVLPTPLNSESENGAIPAEKRAVTSPSPTPTNNQGQGLDRLVIY